MGKNGDVTYWVGFDLGGTKMLTCVYDPDFKPLALKRRKTKAHEGAKAGLARMVELVESALEEAGVTRKQVGAIGIGSPGPLDLAAGEIIESPNLAWKRAPLRTHFKEAFGVPAIVLNDVDAGVYGEYRFGTGRKSRCVVGIFPGTGIGGGCVYEGRLISTPSQSCMEIGHLPLVPDGPLCGCGRRGCLEAVASRLAIASAAAAAAHRGDAPHLLEAVGTDISAIRSSALADSIAAGDAAVEDIVRTSARWIGRAAAAAVNLLLPDTVVLGGGLVEAMPDLYLPEVQKAARAHAMPAFRKSFKVVVAEMGDDSTVAGAAAWAAYQVGSSAEPAP